MTAAPKDREALIELAAKAGAFADRSKYDRSKDAEHHWERMTREHQETWLWLTDAQFTTLEAAGVRVVPAVATREMLGNNLIEFTSPRGELTVTIDPATNYGAWTAMLRLSPYAPAAAETE